MEVDNELLDSDSPFLKPEEDAITKGKEPHADAMVTAEEPETENSELDLSEESPDPPGPDPFHTPERTPPKHYPEPSKPEIEQRLRDWEVNLAKATLSPGGMGGPRSCNPRIRKTPSEPKPGRSKRRTRDFCGARPFNSCSADSARSIN